ncbi:MAG TPA: hypothetical protein VL335_00175 [Candidatus Paceibacterota bacterium]|jgi:hypothetical protein|nr:hypothetical protein [Candidatus Paceibacterota bacterium]
MLNESDVRRQVIQCKALGVAEDEFELRICPIDFVPTEDFERHNTIIAKSIIGEIIEYGFIKKRKVELRKFFQSGTAVAVITIVPGTERKKRTEKKTPGSPAYKLLQAQMAAAARNGTLTQL